MNPETKQVSQHMKEFGLHILGRAIYDATFSEMMRPFAHMLSVVHAAHGAEILIKARKNGTMQSFLMVICENKLSN